MLSKILVTIYRYTYFDIFILIVALLQGMFDKNTNIILLIFNYTLIHFLVLRARYRVNVFILLVVGIILDSVNDIYIGLSSVLFLLLYLVTYYQIRLLQTIHFFNTYVWFIVNTLVFTIVLFIAVYLLNIDFVNPILYAVISCFFYPIIYICSVIIKLLISKYHEV